MRTFRRILRAAPLCAAASGLVACKAPPDSARVGGRTPPDLSDVRTVPLHSRPELVENSAAAMSATQPGVLFTINDSGNDPLLFAVDTNGADRGVWRVLGASDLDWESAAVAACEPGSSERCVFIGDTGDNSLRIATHTIYRVAEPAARDSSFTGTVTATALRYTYADARHDVEAMYVTAVGDIFLITKRSWRFLPRRQRPALVYRVPAAAWTARQPVVAELVDSLTVEPSAPRPLVVTDASLAPDGRHLAVRTYTNVYVFATDSLTGRIQHGVQPSICRTAPLREPQGEGVTWTNNTGRLVFSSEGRAVPLHIATCPLPSR